MAYDGENIMVLGKEKPDEEFNLPVRKINSTYEGEPPEITPTPMSQTDKVLNNIQKFLGRAKDETIFNHV